MKLITKLITFLVYGNVCISLCAIACLQTNLLLLDKKVDFFIYCIVFFGTFCAYQISFLGLKKATSSKFQISALRFKIFKASFWISLFILSLFCIIYLSIYQLCFLLHLSLIAIIYTLGVPNLSKKNKHKLFIIKPLRLFLFQKTFWVAYVWASLTLFFPFCETLDKINYQLFLFFIARFLMMWCLTLPFDIRDAITDKEASLQTIYLRLGHKKYVILIAIILFISFLLHSYLFPQYYISFFVIHLVIFLLNLFAKPQNHELYFTGFIDGTLIMEFLVLISQKYLV